MIELFVVFALKDSQGWWVKKREQVFADGERCLMTAEFRKKITKEAKAYDRAEKAVIFEWKKRERK